MADNPVVPVAAEPAESELPEWAIEGDIIPQTDQKVCNPLNLLISSALREK